MAVSMVSGGKYHCSLSDELQKKALSELNEKAEWRDRDIQALREMVLAHKGLKCPTTDEYLLRFLRAKKFDYDRAYHQLINYYDMRAKNVDYIGELRPSTVMPCLDAGVSCILPYRDKLGRRILYFRPAKWTPSEFSIYQILKVNLMSLELIIQEEETQVNGVAVIGNMKDVGWTQAKAVERNYMKIMTGLLQEAFPLRFKGMNIVKEPSVFQHIFSIVKPFLKEKTRARMKFYGSNIQSLQETFGIDILPEELGGKLPHGDILAQEWKRTLISQEDYFTSLSQYHIEINHHITSSKSGENAECVVGSYRKLNID